MLTSPLFAYWTSGSSTRTVSSGSSQCATSIEKELAADAALPASANERIESTDDPSEVPWLAQRAGLRSGVEAAGSKNANFRSFLRPPMAAATQTRPSSAALQGR